MNLKYKKVCIREATVEDAEQLCTWWNDGNIMEHAGFPNGLGTTQEKIAEQITEKTGRHMIVYDNIPIGEMNYMDQGNEICEIGIKICNIDMQNHGIGKIVLSLFIEGLFNELNYKKIILDTNLENKRAQHVYEQLGFKRVRINVDSWRDQLGNLKSSVDYELTKKILSLIYKFNNQFTKG